MDPALLATFKTRISDFLKAAQIIQGPAELEKYEKDETEDLRLVPDLALLPASEAELSRIMALATELRIPVTPFGGGTGLSGGALALHGGVSLSLEKMNAILEIDEANLMVRVQPGVILADLHAAVEEKNLFYPPDPSSKESCTLGGNLAEDAGGPRAVKYGVTSAYVRGLRAVLPSGEVISCGGMTLKDVAGYNLSQVLVGSEGTLALITEATLRLLPLPPLRRTILARFDDLDHAARAVPAIIRRGIVPVALEFMEGPAIRAGEAHLGETFPHSDAAALLLIELDGFHQEVLEQEIEKTAEAAVQEGAGDVLFATTRAQQEKLWRIRRSLGEAVKKVSAYRELDTAVPRMKIPDLVRGTHKICDHHQLTLLCYGHAGDGNLHMNVLINDLGPKEWQERISRVTREVFDLATSLGGTITGEHGVGLTARPYLARAIGKKNVALMQQIKNAFDPLGILNPGKIFEPEPS